MTGRSLRPRWLARERSAALGCVRRAILAICVLPAAASLACSDPLEGRLKTIRDTGTLRIAYRTDSRPFSFVPPGERHPTGYTIELCQRIAKSLEGELGVTLAIQWVPVDSRTRFTAITDGTADMECGSTTMTLSRMKIVDFSSMVFAESTGVLVRSNIGINRVEDMAGKTIGVVPGSSNAQAVRAQLVARKLDVKVVEFRDREEGVGALAQNAVDGFATDKSVLVSLAQGNAGQFTLLPEDLSFEPFAVMLPRGDADFRLAVNTGLARLFRSGDVIAIYGRYFSGVAPRSVWLGAVFMFGGLPE
jgi:glutamate/aspartate transport system substrate-binding protein